MIELIIGAAVLFVLGVLFVSTYTVVDPNEAHVVVFMGSGRKYYGPGDGQKSAYFYIPVIMKRYVLPLTNVKMVIDSISLNDQEMAPFICDVATWVRIDNPRLAAERLNLKEGAFLSLRNDMVEIVQAIARAASMKQEILDIMRDRKNFATSVTQEVQPILAEWGVALVGLEVNTIRDTNGSTVIADYQSIREATIKTQSRVAVAEKDREAVEAEQDNYQKAQLATAQAQEISEKRFVEKDRVVGIAAQEQEKEVAIAQKEANGAKVEAARTLEVGSAEVRKEALIQDATGQGEAIRIKGEKDAEVIKMTAEADAKAIELKGTADGVAIEKKGLAEALSKEKMAEALQKFNDAATTIEKIRAAVEVQVAFAQAYAKVAENADIKVVTGGGDGNSFLGLPLNAMGGAQIGQFLEGLDTEAIGNALKTVTEVTTGRPVNTERE